MNKSWKIQILKGCKEAANKAKKKMRSWFHSKAYSKVTVTIYSNSNLDLVDSRTTLRASLWVQSCAPCASGLKCLTNPHLAWSCYFLPRLNIMLCRRIQQQTFSSFFKIAFCVILWDICQWFGNNVELAFLLRKSIPEIIPCFNYGLMLYFQFIFYPGALHFIKFLNNVSKYRKQ